ncbi:DUF2268 domain-containing putative Zn-dependent protease [Chryseobacterium tructae]|uniref:DUF2268 domain-containing putative Zn-dependent protease n=1 Tax=Chryseobacterium tructae TaxID=1037380 RepID=A0ABV7Y1N7_9FLAO|nr:DUF2268 domain-containing putative Zn-dependent protease [Chryseobacterium tructae]MDN3694192.1 DUF2268 domain-containing putative Zn-dependent protease [Chryseobacterium tructae]
MNKLIVLFLIFFALPSLLFGQKNTFKLNDQIIAFDGKEDLNYTLPFEKGKTYIIKVYQENIDIEINLYNSDNQKIASTDVADGNKGYDKLEYTPEKNEEYRINIKSVSPKLVSNGIVKINIRTLGKSDIEWRTKKSEEVKTENLKDITTIDIQHFWEAYDKLKYSKSNQDSVDIIQKYYLDRGTNGLKEFQKVRYFSAEFFVERIKKYKKYYESIRGNTVSLSKSEKFNSIISDFTRLYAKSKPAKIAFTIGPVSTGGTISGHYLLIGVEMFAGDKNSDISEITNENLKADIVSRSNQNDVIDYVKETVVHEYIHTQQVPIRKDACKCSLLESVIKEGVASYISEKLMMNRTEEVKSRAALYANTNEKQLWMEMKNELCTTNLQNWLFNAASSKDRPGDLGYRIGYKIAEAYYKNAFDKEKAIEEMIEMDNPLLFLDKSKYDLKFR